MVYARICAEAPDMARRNLTLQSDQDVIRRAKVLAAKRGTSASRLVVQDARNVVTRRRFGPPMRRGAAREGRRRCTIGANPSVRQVRRTAGCASRPTATPNGPFSRPRARIGHNALESRR